FFGAPSEMARVIGGPEWIDSDRYEINAKASTPWQPTTDGPPRELFLMIRSLLEERFRLVTHHEVRDMPIFELVVARADGRLGPGLQKSVVDCDAVAAARRAGVVPPPRKPLEPPPCALMGGPARTVAGGVTMEQFAAHLGMRVERPVVDKTGLTDR